MEKDDLFKAVLADPDSDAPDEEWERLMTRLLALFKAHPKWREFPALAGIEWGHGMNFGFERGFLDSVMVSGSEAFTKEMGRVFEAAPVTKVVFEKIDDAGIAVIARSQFLARLRHLQLDFCPIGDAAAEELAGSQHVAGLRSLRFFGCGVGSR